MLFKSPLIFLVFMFSFMHSFANENAIKVMANDYVYGGAKISKYSGPINTWDYDSLIPEIDNFEPFNSALNSGAPDNKIHWIYFELFNPNQLDLWVSFGTSRLNKIRIFELDDDLNIVDTTESGFDIGRDYRAFGSYKFRMPIMSEHEENGKFLVGYYSRSGLHETHICFGTQDKIEKEAFYGGLYTYLFAGVFFILFCYNLVLFFSLNDRIYLFYSLNLISNFFASTYAVNYPFVSVFFGEELTQTYAGAWVWILPFTMTLFTVQYFDLKRSGPLMYRILLTVLGLNLLNAIGMLFLPIHIASQYGMVFLVLFFAICAYIGYDQMKKKHSLAFLYFVSWVIVFIGIILYFLVVQLGVFYSEIGHYANHITSSIEALLFSIALGKRYQIILRTEQKTASLLTKRNEMLVLANESLDSFNYHVSHDLKTVMVNTVSLNKMIKKYTLNGKTEKVIQISDRLDKVASKGNDTIEGFLALAAAGKVKDGINEEIQVVSSINYLLKSNDLESITVEFDEIEFDTILFNRVEFNSMFLNLLTNSKKYTSLKPLVRISLKLESDNYKIIYSDNGIGVDLEKDAELLFSPFRRVKNNLKQEGSGVGLFLVKKIINEYGGSIIPESELGKGLTFIISLPRNTLT